MDHPDHPFITLLATQITNRNSSGLSTNQFCAGEKEIGVGDAEGDAVARSTKTVLWAQTGNTLTQCTSRHRSPPQKPYISDNAASRAQTEESERLFVRIFRASPVKQSSPRINGEDAGKIPFGPPQGAMSWRDGLPVEI